MEYYLEQPDLFPIRSLPAVGKSLMRFVNTADVDALVRLATDLKMIESNKIRIVTGHYESNVATFVEDLGDTLYQKLRAVESALAENQTCIVKDVEERSIPVQLIIEQLRKNHSKSTFDSNIVISEKFGPCFPLHTDDVDVYLVVLRGSKLYYFDEDPSPEDEITLGGGGCIFIPTGQRHAGEAIESSVVLSIGVQPKQRENRGRHGTR